MIQTKFGFHWSSTFRGEDFWKSLRRTTDAKFYMIGRRINNSLLTCFMRTYAFLAHLTQRVMWAIAIPNFHSLEVLPTKYRFVLAKQFQRRRFFRKRPIRKKNCLWWPCLSTDWDKMSNLYKRTVFFQVCTLQHSILFLHCGLGKKYQ
jgi:hypothetical protein